MNNSEVVEKSVRYAEWLLRLFSESYEVIDFDVFVRCFEEPEDGVRGNVVSFLNHGPFHSTLVILPILLKTTYEYGLHTERPGVIFHTIVNHTPVLRTIAKRLTSGHPATSIEEAVRNLKTGVISMYGTMPEGINALFEYDHPIGPFDKNGLIVVGLKARSKFVLCVHKGTEDWYWELPMNLSDAARENARRLLGPGMSEMRAFRVPRLSGSIRPRLKFLRYTPTNTYEQYESASRRGKRALIAAEAERMRAIMQREYDAL